MKIAVLYEPTDNIAPELTPPRPPKEHRHPEKKKSARPRKAGRPKLDREEVFEALKQLGHEAFFYELGSEEKLLELAKTPADLVFNLTEAYSGDDTKEPHVAAYLDLLQLRYTGSGPWGLHLAQDKALAKKVFQFHKIRTPFFAIAYKGRVDFTEELEFPLIVKPVAEDGSVGIDAGSVVSSIKELLERIDLVQQRYDSPAIIEEYIEGREIYAGVLGNERPEALPLVELDLSRLPKGMPRIAGKEVKWETETQAYRRSKSEVARDLDAKVAARLRDTALSVFAALELRDYARIDMRLAPDGTVYVIEANPNPWLASGAELAMAARESGRSYTRLIGDIVGLALARYA